MIFYIVILFLSQLFTNIQKKYRSS